jgi:hypothetical protein
MEDGQELRVLWTRRPRLADQLLKKHPVMNHALAQVCTSIRDLATNLSLTRGQLKLKTPENRSP